LTGRMSQQKNSETRAKATGFYDDTYCFCSEKKSRSTKDFRETGTGRALGAIAGWCSLAIKDIDSERSRGTPSHDADSGELFIIAQLQIKAP
jgi:hypothetical protein